MNAQVLEVYNTYPDEIKEKLLYLRELIYEVASNEEEIQELKETLKWNEPSYLTKGGSTISLE